MVSLKEFGEKYPFLKGNIPFWEKYSTAKNAVKNILLESADTKILDSNFFRDSDNSTPFLKLQDYRIDKELGRRLMKAFADAMEVKLESCDFPEKVTVLKKLEVTEDVNGFVLAEVHASVCNFIMSVISPDEAANWLEYYCPICGGEAGMGIIVNEGKKQLVCSHCHSLWYDIRTKCGICGHLPQKEGNTFFSDDDTPQWFIEICKECNSSLKVFDTRKDEMSIDIYPLFYLTTWGLDIAMTEKEYDAALFAVYERAGWLK